MSADGDGADSGPGRREVAHRLFATEFDDATVSYAESDEERAPKYVVTPTGARVNRLFAVGVLTEVESVNEDVLRARVVDPTGAFVSYAGQYQPDAAAFFERTEPPAFVALTGKARTFEPDDGDRIYTSVRPESVSVVDGETRDRWTVSAAEATLHRVAAVAEAKSIEASGEALDAALADRGYDGSLASGIATALDRYSTTTAYLDAVREVALDALAVVTGDREAVRSLDVASDEAGTESLGPMPAAVTADSAGEAEPTASSTETTPPVDGTDAPAAEDDENTADDATTPGSPESAPAEREDGVTADGETTDTSTADDAAATADASTTPEPVDDSTGAIDRTEDPIGGDDGPGEFDDGPGDFDDDDLGDFDDDDLYELDDEERREVEEEFDVGFESGAEVDDPGEAGIDVPGPEDLDAADGSDEADDAIGSTASESNAADTDAETDDDEVDVPDDVNLETAAVEVMDELDGGDGADREAVIAAVVDEYAADPSAVGEAIEDALMSGRCYEPSEDRLKAI